MSDHLMCTYIVQESEKSFCPRCDRSVMLLCPKTLRRTRKPWFYICFWCRSIYEVGRGELKEET